MYKTDEIQAIDTATRRQNLNKNWYQMRKFLITASQFKTVCHSQNWTNTSLTMLSGPSFTNDNTPEHIEFGQRYESKARDQFFKVHSYKHKKCKIEVPGLILNASYPFLGASPDGVLQCSKCSFKHLVEVKCLSSKMNYQPSGSLVLNGICTKDDKGLLSIVKHHQYNYQIQGQMATTGISKCWFLNSL